MGDWTVAIHRAHVLGHAGQFGWKPTSLTENGPAIATSLTEGETKALQEIGNGEMCLEIGSAWGYSACAMALGGASCVHAVDNHSWLPSLPVMQEHLRVYGVEEQVTIYQGWSGDVLPELLADGCKYGLIFIDGDHGYAGVAQDIDLARPLLAPGGVLALHDHNDDNPDVRRAAAERLGEPKALVDSLAVYYWDLGA